MSNDTEYKVGDRVTKARFGEGGPEGTITRITEEIRAANVDWRERGEGGYTIDTPLSELRLVPDTNPYVMGFKPGDRVYDHVLDEALPLLVGTVRCQNPVSLMVTVDWDDDDTTYESPISLTIMRDSEDNRVRIEYEWKIEYEEEDVSMEPGDVVACAQGDSFVKAGMTGRVKTITDDGEVMVKWGPAGREGGFHQVPVESLRKLHRPATDYSCPTEVEPTPLEKGDIVVKTGTTMPQGRVHSIKDSGAVCVDWGTSMTVFPRLSLQLYERKPKRDCRDEDTEVSKEYEWKIGYEEYEYRPKAKKERIAQIERELSELKGIEKHRADDYEYSEKRITALQNVMDLIDSGKKVLVLVPDLFSGHADYIRMGGAMRGVYVVTMGSGSFIYSVLGSWRFDYIAFDDGMDKIAILPVDSPEGQSWMPCPS